MSAGDQDYRIFRHELRPFNYNPIHIDENTFYPIYRKKEDETFRHVDVSLDLGKTWHRLETVHKMVVSSL